MARVTKISIKDSRIAIKYEIDQGDSVDLYTMETGGVARPAFYDALKRLAIHVEEWLEIKEQDWHRNLEVRGVSLSYSNDNVMGATITALKPLKNSNSPMVINTPHKPEEPYSEGGDTDMCLTDECVDVLLALIGEAEDYIDGKRAQGELFEKDEAA